MIKKFSQNTFLILVIFLIIGGFFRFYKITSNPNSLNIDEVSIGYNAYSILKTGKDEYGNFLPLSFKSVGDFKPPVLIYLMVPSIALFGLNEFGVRFPVALISTLTIVFLYLLAKELTGNRKYGIIAAAFLTISPWHIYFSRYAVEAQVALAALILGIYFLLKFLKGNAMIGFVSALFLALSMYAYHSERLFVPLIIIFLLVYKRNEFVKIKFKTIGFLSILGVFLLPLLFLTLFGNEATRAKSTFITNDIEFTRNILVEKDFLRIGEIFKPVIGFFGDNNFLLFFYWIRKYLNYFQPSFLFYSGLNLTTPGILGLGVMYIFELPFLILGIYKLLKEKIRNKEFVFGWILLGLIPASLTQNEQHALRSLVVLPMLILVLAIGFIDFFEWIKKLSILQRRIIGVIFGLFIFWNLCYAIILYAYHFPKQRDEDFMAGTKQAVEYILYHQNEYKEVVFDPSRGIYAPNIISIPHTYILFYSKYDPLTYQTESKIQGNDFYHFNKYTIRKIDWGKDRSLKQTLFVGSPWSLPEKDLDKDQIKEEIYLSGLQKALLVVSSKQ